MFRFAIFALLASLASYASVVSGQEQARRDSYVFAHQQELTQPIRTAIRSGRVRVGMTRGQALASWGRPTVVIRYGGGRREQWVYQRFARLNVLSPHAWLHFEDGRLISWKRRA